MPERVDEYELIRLLGHGAMGQVYQAVDTLLGRPVAVKFIAQNSPSDTARERFLIEARAIARLQHPNVVSIYRVGVTQGRPYLVSELVRGQSLDSVPLPMPWTRVLNIAVQISRGLAAAHRQGVLHRDLKPGNDHGEGDDPDIVPRWREATATQSRGCGTKSPGPSPRVPLRRL